MHLTPSLADHVLSSAKQSYLDFVFNSLENGKAVSQFSDEQRSLLIQKLAVRAVLACDSQKQTLSASVFRQKVDEYFLDTLSFLIPYKEFEIEQAKRAGLLEPGKIVADLLGGTNPSYKDKSTLESHAVVALNKSKELGYGLAEILDYVYGSLKGTGVYSSLVGP